MKKLIEFRVTLRGQGQAQVEQIHYVVANNCDEALEIAEHNSVDHNWEFLDADVNWDRSQFVVEVANYERH